MHKRQATGCSSALIKVFGKVYPLKMNKMEQGSRDRCRDGRLKFDVMFHSVKLDLKKKNLLISSSLWGT